MLCHFEWGGGQAPGACWYRSCVVGGGVETSLVVVGDQENTPLSAAVPLLMVGTAFRVPRQLAATMAIICAN